MGRKKGQSLPPGCPGLRAGPRRSLLILNPRYELLLFTFFLEGGVKWRNMDSCSSSVLRKVLGQGGSSWVFLFFFFFFFCLFAFSRAAPAAYGGSQARGRIRSCSHLPIPQPQQCWIQAASATYITASQQRRIL